MDKWEVKNAIFKKIKNEIEKLLTPVMRRGLNYTLR